MDSANIVLAPALQVIFDRLASPLLQKLADVWDFKDNFQSLRDALMMVQATLEDAEQKQLTNRAVRLWLSNLKNAASNADDLLDYLTAEEAIKGSAGTIEFLTARYTDADRVRKMLQQLEMNVTEGLSKLNVSNPTQPRMVLHQQSDNRETTSFVVDSEIYGREDDRKKLVKMLLSCEASLEGYATCIPIIGIGGIGKTTLAQLAYNDDRVIQQFDTRMWVFVSHDFNVKKIMKTIIESATKDECKFSETELLQSRLWHLLQNKKFLLVLDDVWTEDQDDWDKLRPLFRGSVEGCKIIITTRMKKIAFVMDSPNLPYYLNGLDDDHCWDLFKQRAFGRGEKERYPHLLGIGKQIVKKCGGVPLAAKSLGSLMRFKREESQWLFVQNSEFWKLEVCQDRVLPALMLSYLHLPLHLRQCFAFCSLFPKNYEFKRQKLIHVWMAEGLILKEWLMRPEDIGNEYFADLMWMSFFHEVELCDGGGITGYKMNDVVHDLARYVAGEESVILEQGLPTNTLKQIRHSSIVYKYRAITIPEALYEADHLRTLLLIGEAGSIAKFKKLLSSFVYLRVLDLNSCDVYKLPESLDSLICLRYLDLSYTPISMLPVSTANLCLMQTLNLFGCHNLKWLPSVGKMTVLRHLNLSGCESLSEMPSGIENLLQLQTLPLYVVSRNQGDLSKLEHLNLYGVLNITLLKNARHATEAQLSGLKMKENLETLRLYWGVSHRFEDVDISFHKPKAPTEDVGSGSQVEQQQQQEPVEEILEGLQPHQNLKNLVIGGYPGIRFPHWTLPKLNAVELINCKNCEYLPALGNLLQLKTLSVHGMDGVKRIGTEFYGDGADIRFSSLEELSLSNFPNLEDWSSANNENSFPSLSKLTVNKCPRLAHIPLAQSLQHLELRDCNPMLMAIANLTLLSVLVIEKLPNLLSLPEGLFASARLSSLKILSCPKLHSLPSQMGNHIALKSLTIRSCEKLSSLPQTLQNLKALESLEISDCHSIITMPDGGIGGLNSLRMLSIENCTNLISLSSSLENLTFLEHLTIMYCPNLSSFPDGVHHLSALRSLAILSCPCFFSLPNGLQHVRTLHRLEVSCFPNLTTLPEWFENLASLRSLTICDCPNLKSLPPGLKLLTRLQHLSIQECPELEERCRQGSGEDWLKIAHVPHIYIGSHRIRQSSEGSNSGGTSAQ